MAERNRPHIHVPFDERWRSMEPYTPHGGGGGGDGPGPPPGGRAAHAGALKDSIDKAVNDAQARQTSTAIDVTGAKPGLYLEFVSFPGWELAVGSMDHRLAKDPHKHVEVVAVLERIVG